MNAARYLVSGRRAFRGHEPGEVFEAVLDPGQESRAVARGSIRLIERFTPTLPPHSYRLPAGWVNPTEETDG